MCCLLHRVNTRAPQAAGRFKVDLNSIQVEVDASKSKHAKAGAGPRLTSATTPLHKAAKAGWEEMVMLLVDAGGNLFAENVWGQTAADVATASGHTALGDKMEAFMVLGPLAGDTVSTDDAAVGYDFAGAAAGEEASHKAAPEDAPLLRATSFEAFASSGSILMEKEAMVTSTAQLLRVERSVAEPLLQVFNFDQRALLQSFMRDPSEACRRAGVAVPHSAVPTVRLALSLSLCMHLWRLTTPFFVPCNNSDPTAPNALTTTPGTAAFATTTSPSRTNTRCHASTCFARTAGDTTSPGCWKNAAPRCHVPRFAAPSSSPQSLWLPSVQGCPTSSGPLRRPPS